MTAPLILTKINAKVANLNSTQAEININQPLINPNMPVIVNNTITNDINVTLQEQSVLSEVVKLGSSAPIALKNVSSFTGSTSKFTVEELTNVVVVERIQNSTLSYSEMQNKYEIKQLTLDGGGF